MFGIFFVTESSVTLKACRSIMSLYFVASNFKKETLNRRTLESMPYSNRAFAQIEFMLIKSFAMLRSNSLKIKFCNSLIFICYHSQQKICRVGELIVSLENSIHNTFHAIKVTLFFFLVQMFYTIFVRWFILDGNSHCHVYFH